MAIYVYFGTNSVCSYRVYFTAVLCPLLWRFLIYLTRRAYGSFKCKLSLSHSLKVVWALRFIIHASFFLNAHQTTFRPVLVRNLLHIILPFSMAISLSLSLSLSILNISMLQVPKCDNINKVATSSSPCMFLLASPTGTFHSFIDHFSRSQNADLAHIYRNSSYGFALLLLCL